MEFQYDKSTTYTISLTIEDIDKTIINYIKENVDLEIIENDKVISTPIYYASPERWKTIQQDGFMRDKVTSQIILPIITFKRTNIEGRTDVAGFDLDGNLTVPINSNPSKKYFGQPKVPIEYYSIPYPKHIKLSYEFILFTKTIRQNNKLVESFIVHSKRYWGSDKFKFFSKLNSISNETEITTDTTRIIKSNFTLEVDGFLIPKTFKGKPTIAKKLGTTKVNINSENIL